MGDNDYAEQCQGWLDGGTKAMEEELWADGYYLNFYDKRTGQKSDAVMGYQLDGQWIAWGHGDGELVRTDRINAALETIKRCNVALVPEYGAATFTQPDGSAMPADSCPR